MSRTDPCHTESPRITRSTHTALTKVSRANGAALAQTVARDFGRGLGPAHRRVTQTTDGSTIFKDFDDSAGPNFVLQKYTRSNALISGNNDSFACSAPTLCLVDFIYDGTLDPDDLGDCMNACFARCG